jgi:hypothetical protein
MNAMHPYMNEDLMFERLKDLQREMENSRLTANTLPGFVGLVRNLSARAWWLAGLAMRRPPRRRPVPRAQTACAEDAASDAA